MRKQFQKWMVPTKIRQQFGLKDGDECTITAHLGAYSLEPKGNTLTESWPKSQPKMVGVT